MSEHYDDTTLSHYLDGALDPDRQAQVEAHLDACKLCQSLLDDLLHAPLAELPSLFFLPVQKAAHKDEPTPQLPERYQLLGLIGKGGMGLVLRVRDRVLRRELALKTLQLECAASDKYRWRFLAETLITAQLQHPGIPPVHDRGDLPDGRPFLVMKLVKGKTLAELLRDQESGVRGQESGVPGPAPDGSLSTAHCPLPTLLVIFEQICDALAYAHQHAIIHRDLKPANVMVGAHADLQVMDWGLAKKLAPKTEADPDTVSTAAVSQTAVEPPTKQEGMETRGPLGTYLYMAPEQAGGLVHHMDERSDVFGLGAILCEILTGKPPYAGEEDAKLANLGGAYARLEQCPAHADLKQLTRQCLAKTRAARPRTAKEVADAVKAFREQEQQRRRQAEIDRAAAEVKAQEERKRRLVERQKRRRTQWLAAAVVLLVVGAAGAGAWYLQHQATLAADSAERTLEEERRQAARKHRQKATEQGIVDALGKARQHHDDLHAQLKKKGGVFELLNKPGVWQQHLELTREALRRAKNLHNRAEEPFPTLAEEIDKLEKKNDKDDADRKLALRLEKIREDRSVIVEGKFDHASAEREYAEVFAGARLKPEAGQEASVAERIAKSAIRDYLVAALDDWAILSGPRRSVVLATARLASSDHFGQRLRDQRLWKDRKALEELANETLQKQGLNQFSPQTLDLLARLLHENDSDAEKFLRKAKLLYPADFWINFGLAYVLSNKKNPQGAAGVYHTALAIRPQSVAAWSNLGLALHDQKDLASAIDAYNKALAIDPKLARAWSDLGSALHDQKDLAGAIDAYKKALAVDPRHARAWANLGDALRDQRDLAGAIAACKKALAIDPKFAPAWSNLGNALYDQKDLAGAIDAYKKALAIDPKFAKGWSNLGNALRDQRDLAGAIDAHKKALAIDPKFAGAWDNLGIALHEQKDLAGAIQAHKKALAIDPKLARAWSNLGVALHKRKDSAGAISAFNKALAIEPKDANYWSNLGAALGEQNDFVGSIDAYKKAVAIDPKRGGAHVGLGQSLLEAGEFGQAAKSFQQALDLIPERHPLRGFAQSLLQSCQRLLALEQRLPMVLGGEKSTPAEQLAAADLCQRYRQRYRIAARLYAEAFAADPKLAEDSTNGHRYNAACAAALAAAGKGKGVDNLDDKERAKLRSQALAWLGTDLAAWTKALERDPPSSVTIQGVLKHWETDADLASVREDKDLARLPKEEQTAWLQFWSDVEMLRKTARMSYTEMTFKGTLTAKDREQVHEQKMTAGKTYVIDMTSPHFDTYLRLEDAKKKVLAENDDIDTKANNLNSRLVFTPKEDGVYRLIATSFEQRGAGAYTLTIREFAGRQAKENE